MKAKEAEKVDEIQKQENGIQEVSGSIPLISTIEALKTIGFQGFFFVEMVVLPLKCHFSEPSRYTQLRRYTLS